MKAILNGKMSFRYLNCLPALLELILAKYRSFEMIFNVNSTRSLIPWNLRSFCILWGKVERSKPLAVWCWTWSRRHVTIPQNAPHINGEIKHLHKSSQFTPLRGATTIKTRIYQCDKRFLPTTRKSCEIAHTQPSNRKGWTYTVARPFQIGIFRP